MKKLTALFIIAFLQSFLSNAQLLDNLSIGFESNAQWYNDDKKTGPFLEDEHIRSNNYLKLDYTFKNWYIGTQFESYIPKPLLSYSPKLDDTNIALYFIGYKSKKLHATAGHFYEQFGNGLILRSWEDRELGLNNALLGGKIKYSPFEYLSVTGLYGKHREGFKTSEGEIFGFDTTFDLSNLLKFKTSLIEFGFSYVGRYEKINIDQPNFDDLTNAFSGRIDYSYNNFYSSIEYVSKSDDAIVQVGQISNTFIKDGNAILFNSGFSKKGFGVDFTFRRLENMTFYSDRDATGNIYNENVVNYLPALTKQQDYSLTNIYVYQAQAGVSFLDPSLMKAGEIGGQLDVFYSFKKETLIGGKYGTKIAINGSYWANLKGDYDYNNFDYETDIFGFGEKYYSEISLEIRKKWSNKWSSIFLYMNQYYNTRYIEDNNNDTVEDNIFVLESTYKMSKGKSIRLEAQHLSTKDDLKNWVGGTLEFNVNSKLSFYTSDIYNYGNDDSDKRIHYYNIGGSFTKGAHRLALSYGRQRGGLLCVGGVCRVVPESTGLSMSITSSF